MGKKVDSAHNGLLDAELDTRRKAVPWITEAIIQEVVLYQHAAGNRIASIEATLSQLFSLRSVRENREAKDLLQQVAAAFEDLRHMIRSLSLPFERLRETRAQPLSQCVKSVIDNFTATIQRQAVKLEVVVDNDESGRTLVPAYLLEEVMGCLLRNSLDALKSVRRGGLIRIIAVTANGQMEVSIEDDGPGIPPDILPTIGQAFFTTRPNQIGLGLYLARALLEQVGGKIIVGNRRPKGAKVIAVIPINWKEHMNEKSPVD